MKIVCGLQSLVVKINFGIATVRNLHFRNGMLEYSQSDWIMINFIHSYLVTYVKYIDYAVHLSYD